MHAAPRAQKKAGAAGKRRHVLVSASPRRALVCEVSGCRQALTGATHGKLYSQRYRICALHLRSEEVNVGGVASRWCQICSRFHELALFNGKLRSCSEKLELIRQRRKARQQAARSSAATAEEASSDASQDVTAADTASPDTRQQPPSEPVHTAPAVHDGETSLIQSILDVSGFDAHVGGFDAHGLLNEPLSPAALFDYADWLEASMPLIVGRLPSAA